MNARSFFQPASDPSAAPPSSCTWRPSLSCSTRWSTQPAPFDLESYLYRTLWSFIALGRSARFSQQAGRFESPKDARLMRLASIMVAMGIILVSF